MTTIMLKDAPGGPEFIERSTKAAADIALAFVGEPDEKVRAALEQSRTRLQAELAPQIGAEAAEQVAGALVTAVVSRKAELDAAREGNLSGHEN
jgi:hypothetical protein